MDYDINYPKIKHLLESKQFMDAIWNKKLKVAQRIAKLTLQDNELVQFAVDVALKRYR